MSISNGSNSPAEFPDKVGADNTTGISGAGGWSAGSTEPGNAQFTSEYGGAAQQIDNTSAEAYACGQPLEAIAAQTGKVDKAALRQLADELSIGLDPKSRQLVFEAIGRLAETGRTVLLVEQNARSGLAASHHGAVLEAGVVALTGSGQELPADPEVARLSLGAAATQKSRGEI